MENQMFDLCHDAGSISISTKLYIFKELAMTEQLNKSNRRPSEDSACRVTLKSLTVIPRREAASLARGCIS